MYKKILGPLDGSKLSECSLDHIKAVAMGCHVSDVVLLAVLEPVLPSYSENWGSQETTQQMVRQWQQAEKENRQKAQNYITKAADSLKKEGVAVNTAIIDSKVGKGVAESILDYAQSNGVDLIIMSTHGRSGVTRFTFGSVADKVVRHAQVPVITVTPTSCRST